MFRIFCRWSVLTLWVLFFFLTPLLPPISLQSKLVFIMNVNFLTSTETEPPVLEPVLPLRVRPRVGRGYALFVPFLFSVVSFFTYFDRGAVVGSMSNLRRDPLIGGQSGRLSDTQCGMLVSVFMVGFMCACPLFAALGKYCQPKLLIVIGLSVWCGCCFLSGWTTSYTTLLLVRAMVGVGEASFIGYGITVIDNVAPPSCRTIFIGIFYATIPVGTAAGMIAGGVVCSQSSVFGHAPWRSLFIGEAVAFLLFFVLLCTVPGETFRVAPAPQQGEEEEEEAYIPVVQATCFLIRDKNYVFTVLGNAAQCFVVGSVSVWAISLLVQGPLHFSDAAASTTVGCVTSIGGLVGSVAGGVAVDLLGGSKGRKGIAKCIRFCLAMIAISIPLGWVAIFATNPGIFTVAFFVSVVAIFAITAPLNVAVLTMVPAVLRPYAVGYTVFVIHLCGDFPSPTMTGALSDQYSDGCTLRDTIEKCAEGEQCFWG
ncbi:major facilitator superfamily protein (MFS) [Angomonas deanei]|nr:major facilitator superfamily protein (MFS) [Angomonas deanei]|eukprot:EPY43528.1 major facilitator superfamily protein (MFS) [Angomonas deanei]